MNIPLHNVIRPGIVHFMAFPATMKGEGPILETCRQILADDFFEVIEISWVKDPAVRAKLLPASWGQSQIVDASHLVIFASRTNLGESDLDAHLKRIAEVRGVAFTHFSAADVVRHPLVARIVEAYEADAAEPAGGAVAP